MITVLSVKESPSSRVERTSTDLICSIGVCNSEEISPLRALLLRCKNVLNKKSLVIGMVTGPVAVAKKSVFDDSSVNVDCIDVFLS